MGTRTWKLTICSRLPMVATTPLKTPHVFAPFITGKWSDETDDLNLWLIDREDGPTVH